MPGERVRTGSDSPPGTGAASPPPVPVQEDEAGGWREEEDPVDRGPYAVREVYGV
jgi:hypothetical protein